MNAQPVGSPHGAPAQSSDSGPGVTAGARTVSLRELNQRSGRIVADVVSSGRPVTVTDRGRPVVRLVPIDPEETPYERLLCEGLIERPNTDEPVRCPVSMFQMAPSCTPTS
ncbi:type II toxin-antitoxin system Phd/YefM family antitoxin [Actinomyces ruminis]|uniref:Antitoxin n=1 Tax=Actinomyces ruminis TaxID=1937003 RepID=A0ABX4MDZ7_9ACTO|nr:type II toxin-antitoxin system Phd/YefM family antitoxin [Actinomyces ruminis]PHP53714.1 type II toxin-antitoxin system Phd/YefM family antitoxin [Actinomyces ruminis]